MASDGAAPSRARAARQSSAAGAADRVRRSHAQTRTTIRVTLAFLAAAALAWAFDASRWAVLHLLLAGGAVSAISGMSLMLTVTWSAAPAPPSAWATAQRAMVAVGAVGVVVGREAELADGVVGAAGAVYAAGLVTLAVLLVVTLRRGVERRFRPSALADVVALAAGVGGVVLGELMALGTPSAARRGAHVTTNLLGLIGFVIAATLPWFAATVGRSKMSRRARPPLLLAAWSPLVVGLVAADAGLFTEQRGITTAGLCAYAVGVAAVLALMPTPTRRQLRWAGPRMLALWAGGAWWIAAVVATAVDASSDRGVFAGRWTLVLVLGAYAQILWGSLAYVLPMLRGGGADELAAGFAVTRSWIGLAAVNAAAVIAAADAAPRVVAVPVAVWVVDGAWRAARVGTRRAERPDVTSA